MRELSFLDIQKLNELKKNLQVESSTKNPSFFRYHSTNTLLNDRIVLSDPQSTTFVQLINNDGSLDVISQYLTAKNLTIDGFSVLNKATINNSLKSKGTLEVNELISSGNVTMKTALIDNLSISNNLGGSSGVLNINEKVINIASNNSSILNIGSIGSVVNIFGTMNYISVEYTNIYNKELVINGVSGTKQRLPTNDIGIYLSNGLDDTIGYLKTDCITGDSFVFKAPSCSYILNTPKLTSNSTILISNEDNVVNIDYLEAVDTKTNRLFVKDVLEVLDNVTMEPNLVSVKSDITTNGSLKLQEDLLVLGNAKINENLDVSGICTFHNGVSIIGSLSTNRIITDELFNVKNGSIDIFSSSYIDSKKANINNISTVDLEVQGKGIIEDITIRNNSDTVGNSLIRGNSKIYGDVQISGDSLIQGNSQIKGNIDIDQDMKIGGILCCNNAMIQGDINVNNLNISGNAYFNGSNVVIDGGLSIRNKGLIVYGQSIFNNKFLCKRGFQIDSGGMSVSGNATFHNSNIFISGNLQILGSIQVSNTIYIKNNLTVDNQTNLKSVKISENLMIDENVKIGNNIDIGGILKTDSLYSNRLTTNILDVIGDVKVDFKLETRNLQVDGDSLLENLFVKKDLKTQGELEVFGNSRCNNGLEVIGLLDCKGLFNVSGNCSISNSIIIGNTLDVSGEVSISNNLDVKGELNVDRKSNFQSDICIGGNEKVLGILDVDGDATISSNTLIKKNLIVEDKLLLNDKFHSHLDSIFYQGMNVYKSSTFRSDVFVYGSQKVNRDMSIGGNVVIKKDLDILNSLDVKGGLQVSNESKLDSISTKNIRVGSNLVINENEIKFGNDLVATHKYLESMSITFTSLTLDDTINRIGDIKDGIYSYLVTTDKINKFEGLGDGVNGQINCIVEDLENNIYVGGAFKTIGSSKIESPYFAKWIRSSEEWESICNLSLGVVQCLLVNSKNEVYLAGSFHGGSNLVRYNPVNHSFTSIEGFDVFIKCLAIDSDDNIFVGGVFETVRGVKVNNLVKFNPHNNLVIGLGGVPGVVSNILMDRNDIIYVTVGFKQIYTYNSSFECVIPIQALFNDCIYTICLDSKDNLYVGGRFTCVTTQTEIIECKSIVKYNVYSTKWESMGEGLYPDIKSIAINLNDEIYATTTTIKPLFKWNNIENIWELVCLEKYQLDVSSNSQINGQILTMIFDSYNHLYLGGNLNLPKGKIARLYSRNKKILRFYNTIKCIENNKAISSRKIIMNSLSDTLTIRFENHIGYITFKAGNIQFIR